MTPPDEWIDSITCAAILGLARRTGANAVLAREGVERIGPGPPAPYLYRRADVEALASERKAAEKPKTPTPSGPNVRACLCCGVPFESEGRFNRLCGSCRADWAGQEHGDAGGRKGPK
jgi:hypothetical protein